MATVACDNQEWEQVPTTDLWATQQWNSQRTNNMIFARLWQSSIASSEAECGSWNEKLCHGFPFICFIKASFGNVVKLIHYSVWTIELMSSLPFESCRGRIIIWSSFSYYCWAELVTSFSLWIRDGSWKCKNRPGEEEERKGSRAGLMKRRCRDITEEATAPSGLNQLSILILPNAILFTYHNMQPLDIPRGHGAAPCRWAIIQSFSPPPCLTHIERLNFLKWLPCMNCVFILGGKSNDKCLPP